MKPITNRIAGCFGSPKVSKQICIPLASANPEAVGASNVVGALEETGASEAVVIDATLPGNRRSSQLVQLDEDLKAVTDGFVEGTNNAAAKKVYEKLRSRAVEHVTNGTFGHSLRW